MKGFLAGVFTFYFLKYLLPESWPWWYELAIIAAVGLPVWVVLKKLKKKPKQQALNDHK